MSPTRKILQRALPVVVSAAALTWVLRSIDVGKAFGTLSWDVAQVLLPSFVVYGAFTLLLEALSILRLVYPTPVHFGVWNAAKIKSASYLLGIVNYTLGAAALTVLLRRRAAIGLGRSASVVLLIGSVDLLLLLAIATLSATAAVTSARFADDDARVLIGTLFAVGGVGFFGGLALLKAPMSLGPLERLRTLTVFEAVRETSLPRLGSLVVLRFFFTCSFIALGATAFYAFGIAPPAGELIVGMIVIGVIAALPIAIAGLGTVQIGLVEFFGRHADKETLVALSLVLTAGMILLRVAIGLVFAREYTREALEQTRSAEA